MTLNRTMTRDMRYICSSWAYQKLSFRLLCFK